MKSFLSSGKPKIHQKFQHLFKTDLIRPANTATPDFKQCHLKG